MANPYVPLTHLPLLRAALEMIRASETGSANTETLASAMNLTDREIQQQLSVLAPLFRQVLRGDDRIISLAQPSPEAYAAAQ
ncbi:hypothetical protein [Mycobacteroides abscessus]|uniref:hypothetical protein n=1 Tax=Mycobacteroides abscessus TaxID=36809 RepID=UPI000C266083|nr:hypothetical protein [Mycobacteroides abscessus]